MSSRARLFVPAGYTFLGEQATMMTMQFLENIITGTEVGMLMSAEEAREAKEEQTDEHV